MKSGGNYCEAATDLDLSLAFSGSGMCLAYEGYVDYDLKPNGTYSRKMWVSSLLNFPLSLSLSHKGRGNLLNALFNKLKIKSL